MYFSQWQVTTAQHARTCAIINTCIHREKGYKNMPAHPHKHRISYRVTHITHTNPLIHIGTHIAIYYSHMYTFTWKYANIHTGIHACIHSHSVLHNVCMHIYAVHVCLHVCSCAHKYTRSHLHIFMYTHTNTQYWKPAYTQRHQNRYPSFNSTKSGNSSQMYLLDINMLILLQFLYFQWDTHTYAHIQMRTSTF